MFHTSNVKLPWPSGHENQKPHTVVPRHCGDDAEVKTWHLTPALPPATMGPGLQRNISLYRLPDIKEIHFSYFDIT